MWRRKRLTDELAWKSENTHKSPAYDSPCEESSARLQAVQRNGQVCWEEGCKACRGKSEFLSLPAKCIMGAFRARQKNIKNVITKKGASRSFRAHRDQKVQWHRLATRGQAHKATAT